MTTTTPGRPVLPDPPPARADAEVRCIHDLLRVSCIWCTPRAGAVDVDELANAGWSTASFHGSCCSCREAIMPGDLVRRRGGGYLCEACANDD